MASHDHEKAMDGLLRRSLARDASPNDDCPNAELLAAYYERSLGADEIARYDLHFSQCTRCREQLAAMVRAGLEIEAEKELALEPVLLTARAIEARPAAVTVTQATSKQPEVTAQKTSRPSRSLIELRWLLPVAAALVLTALVYVRLSSRHTQVASIRDLEAPAQPAPPKLDPNAFDALPIPAAPASASSPAKKAPRSPSTQPAAREAAPPPVRSTASGAHSTHAGATSASRGAAAPKSAAGTGSRRPAGNSSAADTTNAAAQPSVARNEASAPAVPAAPPSESNQAMADSVTTIDSAQSVTSAAPPPAEPSQKSGARGITGRNLHTFGATASPRKSKGALERSTETVVHSPDPKVLYRIASGGFIEHSDDAGSAWLGQLLNASAQFTAGSSPAPQICWLVGRAGIIYRTDDGKNWLKIPPPAASDFTAVVAKDASSATITAADGKIWSTDDAGDNWTPTK
jgi:hypothetical protein